MTGAQYRRRAARAARLRRRRGRRPGRHLCRPAQGLRRPPPRHPDVEARPPGKKIKRLSLLSGGERSLTAVAFLVALFKARPSPFYVMDEVEAALDDVNLQRLISVMEELRENSQLIIITHQKRTMEIADALYGVSMRGDGVTTVISQRLRESEEGIEPEPRADGHAVPAGV